MRKSCALCGVWNKSFSIISSLCCEWSLCSVCEARLPPVAPGGDIARNNVVAYLLICFHLHGLLCTFDSQWCTTSRGRVFHGPARAAIPQMRTHSLSYFISHSRVRTAGGSYSSVGTLPTALVSIWHSCCLWAPAPHCVAANIGRKREQRCDYIRYAYSQICMCVRPVSCRC